MTLGEVKALAQRGERGKAAQLLKQMIQKNPSADAWLWAAKLTDNPDLKRKYLSRARMFDPNHREVKAMLRDLGQSNDAAVAATLASDIVAEMQQFGVNRPVIGPVMARLQPQMRLAILVGLFVLIVALNLSIIRWGLTDDAPAGPPVFPETVIDVPASAFVVYDVTQVETSLSAAQFEFQEVTPTPEAKADRQFTIMLRNGSLVTLYAYAPGTAMFEGLLYFGTLADSDQRQIQNLFITYNVNTPIELVDALVSALQQAPQLNASAITQGATS